MDSRKIVYKETAVILVGEAICVGVMLLVFYLLGYFDRSALLGGITGAILSTLNFFFMALVTSLAADKAQRQEVKAGQALIRNSYTVRLLVLLVLLIACAKSGLFNLFALVLPLVFVQPIITIAEFFRKSGEK